MISSAVMHSVRKVTRRRSDSIRTTDTSGRVSAHNQTGETGAGTNIGDSGPRAYDLEVRLGDDGRS